MEIRKVAPNMGVFWIIFFCFDRLGFLALQVEKYVKLAIFRFHTSNRSETSKLSLATLSQSHHYFRVFFFFRKRLSHETQQVEQHQDPSMEINHRSIPRETAGINIPNVQTWRFNMV